ncbi:MAG: DUF2214 family protein [Mesorhizobium sp.]|nr:DUF2214 family protein [Mesorhizobium sp.]
MFADFVLASLHHVLVFTLLAILATEFVLVRPGLPTETLLRVIRLDAVYGAISVAVITIGVARVIWGIKGWEAYVYNVWFWHKIGAFLIVGLLSIAPTIRFMRWRRSVASDPGYAVSDAEIRAVRRFIHAEAGIFLLIPVFAAVMARYGA